jgi:hypothetical protein
MQEALARKSITPSGLTLSVKLTTLWTTQAWFVVFNNITKCRPAVGPLGCILLLILNFLLLINAHVMFYLRTIVQTHTCCD